MFKTCILFVLGLLAMCSLLFLVHVWIPAVEFVFKDGDPALVSFYTFALLCCLSIWGVFYYVLNLFTYSRFGLFPLGIFITIVFQRLFLNGPLPENIFDGYVDLSQFFMVLIIFILFIASYLIVSNDNKERVWMSFAPLLSCLYVGL